MAESSWPSPAAGRVVADDQYEKLGITLGPTGGVFGDYTNPQLVYADSTGMQVKVAADRYALLRGREWWSGSSIFTKSIASNSSGTTRIDLVVLRLSRSTWDVTIAIVQGTPGAGAPSSTKDLGTTGIFELVLAQVTVSSGAATISAGNVTYVATHIGTGNELRVPSQLGLNYVPLPHPGMTVHLDTGDEYTRNAANNGWLLTGQVGPNSFTATLTGATTNPSLGTGGSIATEYSLYNGKYCKYRGTIKWGTSGGTTGVGQYFLTIPFTAGSSIVNGIPNVGSVIMRDDSSGTLVAGIACVAAGNSFVTFVNSATGFTIGSASPWTWANLDYISFTIDYVIA